MVLQIINKIQESIYRLLLMAMTLLTADGMNFLCLIKALRVLILEHDSDLQDQIQLGEGAYLINDQILALLTGNGMFFLMFNQSTESSNPGPWWWWFTRPKLIAWRGVSYQRANTIKNSKWVWSGNTTIPNCRQPLGTARKSHSTITRHQEDKLSKATSSLFPIKLIAILERT